MPKFGKLFTIEIVFVLITFTITPLFGQDNGIRPRENAGNFGKSLVIGGIIYNKEFTHDDSKSDWGKSSGYKREVVARIGWYEVARTAIERNEYFSMELGEVPSDFLESVLDCFPDSITVSNHEAKIAYLTLEGDEEYYHDHDHSSTSVSYYIRERDKNNSDTVTIGFDYIYSNMAVIIQGDYELMEDIMDYIMDIPIYIPAGQKQTYTISLEEGWNKIKWTDTHTEDSVSEIIESSSEKGKFVH